MKMKTMEIKCKYFIKLNYNIYASSIFIGTGNAPIYPREVRWSRIGGREDTFSVRDISQLYSSQLPSDLYWSGYHFWSIFSTSNELQSQSTVASCKCALLFDSSRNLCRTTCLSVSYVVRTQTRSMRLQKGQFHPTPQCDCKCSSQRYRYDGLYMLKSVGFKISIYPFFLWRLQAEYGKSRDGLYRTCCFEFEVRQICLDMPTEFIYNVFCRGFRVKLLFQLGRFDWCLLFMLMIYLSFHCRLLHCTYLVYQSTQCVTNNILQHFTVSGYYQPMYSIYLAYGKCTRLQSLQSRYFDLASPARTCWWMRPILVAG